MFFFKQKTAYEMRISDWSSDVCSSDLVTLEAKKKAERLLGDDLLDHRHVVAGHLDRVDAEGRLLVVLADAVQQLVDGGDARRARYGRQPAVAGGEHACVRIGPVGEGRHPGRSEEHTSELQSLMRTSYAVFCLKKK